jgi:hypothetical protein
MGREDSLLAPHGWAEMIRKVYEVDPMVCRQCGGKMKVIAFLTNYAVVNRIINRPELTFVAESPRRPTSPVKKFWWLPRPAANTILDPPFPEQEKSG